MLRNGLGEILSEKVPQSARFVDLFSGSSAVARHVAENYPVPVFATDLQSYSSVLADAVLLRTKPAVPSWIEEWVSAADKALRKHPSFDTFRSLHNKADALTVGALATKSRAVCSDVPESLVRAYGGYYFSPLQCLMLHCLRDALPKSRTTRRLGLAALIEAASVCAAAPGHTAQPFKPNETAGKFLAEAWAKNLWEIVIQKAELLGASHALKKGRSAVGDANAVASTLNEEDLVFVDPPYSAVHYSRFYHVLETIASADDVQVSGSGRYPPPEDRPRSDYSITSKASAAMQGLLERLSERRCNVLITFPANEASNGLSGDAVQAMAEKFFDVESATIHGRFSTLGGNTKHRSARQASEELVLSLVPKSGSLTGKAVKSIAV
jgi:adenine-specific DNA-methyltransferase